MSMEAKLSEALAILRTMCLDLPTHIRQEIKQQGREFLRRVDSEAQE